MSGSDDYVEVGYLVESANEHHSYSTAASEEHEEGNTRSHNDDNPNDGAEGIVRKAARTVRNLRAALICLIVTAAASCGVLIYKLATQNEADSFKYNYNEVANKLTQSFSVVLSDSLNYAFVLSVALSSGFYADSNYVPSFPNVSITQFDTITRASRNQAAVTDLIWSPLLFTRDERRSWEAYAWNKLENHSQAAVAATGHYPPCYLCGEGYDIVNVNATMNFPGVGVVTCSEIDVGALGGYTGSQECSYYAPIIMPVCGCQKSVILASN